MSAKIQIKSDMAGTSGGLFLLLDHFDKAHLDKSTYKSSRNKWFDA